MKDLKSEIIEKYPTLTIQFYIGLLWFPVACSLLWVIPGLGGLMALLGFAGFVATEGYSVTTTNMRLHGKEYHVTQYPPNQWNEGFMVGFFIILVIWLSYLLVLGVIG